MIRNLGGALLFLFSSVFVEIALWSHVFLWLDGFSMLKSNNLCYGTLYSPWMSINENVLLELVGLVTFTDRVRCWIGNFAVSICYLSVFTPILAQWHIVSSYRCFRFMCAVTSSITMNAVEQCRWRLSIVMYSAWSWVQIFVFWGGQWWCRA
jgi:hypothetical protein